MNDKDFFTPENIQKLVDQLAHMANDEASEHDDAHLTVALQHIYHRAEERASVERVRQRLANRNAAFTSPTDTQDLAKDKDKDTGDLLYFDVAKFPAARSATSKSVTIPRLLSVIAAVLVVSLVVGNWFVVSRLFQHHASTTSMLPSKTPDNIYIAGKQLVYKLSGTTGGIIWQKKLPTTGAINIKILDGMIFAMQPHDVYALNPLDGTISWHTHTVLDTYVSMIAQDGALYLSGDYQPDKFHISTLFLALNTGDGSQHWRTTQVNTNSRQWFTVQDGALYVRTDKADGLDAIDATTGKLRWQSHEKFDAPGLDDLPLVADGIVYDHHGNHLYALDEKTGRRLWHQQISADRSFYPGRFYSGTFYIYSALFRQQPTHPYEFQERVQAFAARTGATLWTSPVGYKLLSDIPVTDGLIFTERNYQGVSKISALNASSGNARWQFTDSCSACTTISAVVSGKALYLFESYQVLALDIYSGKQLFQKATSGIVITSVSTQPYHDMVYFMNISIASSKPTFAITINAYQLSRGIKRWTHRIYNLDEGDFYDNDYGPVAAA